MTVLIPVVDEYSAPPAGDYDQRHRTGDVIDWLGRRVPAAWRGLTKRALTTAMRRGVEPCPPVR